MVLLQSAPKINQMIVARPGHFIFHPGTNQFNLEHTIE